jgi:hypothetical protein
VSYSGTAHADVVIHVDTGPFDSSVSSVNRHVDALTGAVVAMNAAQVAAINLTSEEVSASILNGFFGTVKAEISQQLQALDSAVKAAFGLIMEQGKAVTQKKEQMEKDFSRIASRYVDIFKNLDAECHKRIRELDKPAFNLSEKIQKNLINEAITGEGAKNYTAINEESSSKMMLVTSSLLRKAEEVIKTLYGYITQESRMTALVDSFVENEQVVDNTALLVPVIFTEGDTLDGNETAGQDYACFIPDAIPGEQSPVIGGRIDSYCRNETPARWKEPEKNDNELIDKEFRHLAETEFAEDTGAFGNSADRVRVYDRLMDMWNNRNFLTLVIDRSRT